MYRSIYIYIFIYLSPYIDIYIYIERGRKKEKKCLEGVLGHPLLRRQAPGLHDLRVPLLTRGGGGTGGGGCHGHLESILQPGTLRNQYPF